MPEYNRRVALVGGIAIVIIIIVLIAGRVLESRLSLPGAGAGTRDTTAEGEQVATDMFEAEVISWDSSQGILKVKTGNRERDIRVTLPEARILIATTDAGTAGGQMTAAASTTDPLYLKAFCPGNNVTLTVRKGTSQAVTALNFGARTCAEVALP